MTKRILAIVAIFLCTSLAWLVLGGVTLFRTYNVEPGLKQRVASSWGEAHVQKPARAEYAETVTRTVEITEDGRATRRTVEEKVSRSLPLDRTRARAAIRLEPRRKGLLWYSTYAVDFGATYGFRNPSDREREVVFTFPLPAARAIYDGITLSVDGVAMEPEARDGAVTARAPIGAGRTAVLEVAYRSRGLESWRYRFADAVARVRDFGLAVTTDFGDIDFPEGTLSPSSKRETAGGWELDWRYESLLSGFEIAVAMPEPLQPGPLAGRISLFAPVSLLFFFFLVFVITTLRGIDLHPMNYFFLAAAFFAFHLLLAYLADHVDLHVAFAVASVVSVFLVVSYLRLVTGWRFAALEAGLCQLLYLVLFSYAFFFEGYTGITVTVGAVITLFVVMQLTGRVRWSDRFSGKTGSEVGS